MEGLLILLALTASAILFIWAFNSGPKRKGFYRVGGGELNANERITRLMRAVLAEVGRKVESATGDTQIGCRANDAEGVLTLVADIEQFEYFRQRKGVMQWEGVFEEQRLEQQWARIPASMRCWNGIELTVPVAIDAAFSADLQLKVVRFWIGDMENSTITICRVSVEAKRGKPTLDWRYDKRARGYLAPIVPHDDEQEVPLISDLASDPYDFEQQVAQMLRSRGLAVEVIGGLGDDGVDIIAHDTTPITGGIYLVQCKRYALDRKVGVADVRELYGAVQEKRASKGVLVTSSTFTPQARRFAEDKPIELIDAVQLSSLIGSENPFIEYTDEPETHQSIGDLHDAVERGELLAIAGMLEIGVDVNAKNDLLLTPLHVAMDTGDIRVISLLLDYGADAKNAENNPQWTPLHSAVSDSNLSASSAELVSLLIAHGTDINAKDISGQTPLHWCAVSSNRNYLDDADISSVIELLLNHGADTRAITNAGQTAYDIAKEQGASEEILELLSP